MRFLFLVALAAALALPHVAAAQTPSVTPTPAPVALTFRFDCDAVPWSCGDGPNDVRWQLYEVVGCGESDPVGCRYERVGVVAPGGGVQMRAGGRYKLFLAPNLDRSDRVSRTCVIPGQLQYPYIGIHSQCTVYGEACAGPANWNLYSQTNAGLVPVMKHIGECSRRNLEIRGIDGYVLHWGLPGELSAAPTAATTMTMPPTVTLTPTVGIPTEVPTISATPTASPTATDAPTATASATSSPTATVTKARGVLLLPRVGR